MSTLPFTPGASKTIATANTTAATTLPTGSGRQLRLAAPAGSDLVYVAFGGASVEASATTSMRLQPGTYEIITLPEAATHIATISSANTPSLNITRGAGS